MSRSDTVQQMVIALGAITLLASAALATYDLYLGFAGILFGLFMMGRGSSNRGSVPAEKSRFRTFSVAIVFISVLSTCGSCVVLAATQSRASELMLQASLWLLASSIPLIVLVGIVRQVFRAKNKY
jgi:hypothetical protein